MSLLVLKNWKIIFFSNFLPLGGTKSRKCFDEKKTKKCVIFFSCTKEFKIQIIFCNFFLKNIPWYCTNRKKEMNGAVIQSSVQPRALNSNTTPRSSSDRGVNFVSTGGQKKKLSSLNPENSK